MGAAVVILTLVVGGGMIAGAITLARRAEQRRTDEMSTTAERLGWGFVAQIPFDAFPDLERFELFSSGHSRKLRNVMTSQPGDLHRVVFDFTYVTGTGKSRHVYQQTVFYAAGEPLRLPAFSLRPENFMHKVAGLFGYGDIDFERRPEFSKAFLLRSEDETQARRAFRDEVLRFFERKTGTCAAGTGTELLFWRPRGFARADAVAELIREGDELALLLSER